MTTTRLLQFKPWHATHMMEKCVVLPTLRKKDPTWKMKTSNSASMSNIWWTMPGDQSQIVNSCLSLVELLTKREVGSLLRMVMLSSLIGPGPSEVVNQLTNPRIIPGESLLFSEKEHGGSWKKQGT